MEKMKKIQKELFSMQDLGYREFHSRLMPTVDKEKVIGVRMPMLRKFAKEFAKTKDAEQFLQVLPHQYYEENNLHGLLIENIRDYEECIRALDEFLPYIDNWATCDLLSPKILKKYPERLIEKVREWIKAENTYTVRFAIKCLMDHYLEDEFSLIYADMAAEVQSEEYYIQMMQAWYFATALAKQYEAVLPYLQEEKLSVWVHNKTIQKAVESYRILPEQKTYLKTLKRKERH